jgi:hypothetical protein
MSNRNQWFGLILLTGKGGTQFKPQRHIYASVADRDSDKAALYFQGVGALQTRENGLQLRLIADRLKFGVVERRGKKSPKSAEPPQTILFRFFFILPASYRQKAEDKPIASRLPFVGVRYHHESLNRLRKRYE